MTGNAEPGIVLDQSVTASADSGSSITLLVAKALPLVPPVKGENLAQAKRTLKRADFKVGHISEQESGKPQGTVLAQTPKAGASARPGSSVKLVIAKPKTEPTSTPQCTPGYSPCIEYLGGADYDCAGGTGDGPYYTGRVTVTGSDPYDLDADGDGVGCE